MNEMTNHSFDRIMDEAAASSATAGRRRSRSASGWRSAFLPRVARHADKFGTKRIDRSYKADYEDYECGSSNLEPLVEYEYEHY